MVCKTCCTLAVLSNSSKSNVNKWKRPKSPACGSISKRRGQIYTPRLRFINDFNNCFVYCHSIAKVKVEILHKMSNTKSYNKTVIDFNAGLGEYHFFRLINPYVDLIEVKIA